MIYYDIIGDVKDSRTLPNRNDVQEKLKKVLLDINRIYNDDLSGTPLGTASVVLCKILYRIKYRFG